MNTLFQRKFDPRDPLQVEGLLTIGGEQSLANKINGQLRLGPVPYAPDRLVIYKIHAEHSVFVMRFLLAKWREDIIENEARIARLISLLVKIEIPKTVFFPADGRIPAFAIHQWIVREPFTTDMYDSMSNKSKRQFVDDLAEFLIVVHSITIGEMADLHGWSGQDLVGRDFGKPKWFGLEHRAEIRSQLIDRLQPEFANAAINTVEEFEQLMVDQADMTFVHGDIHGFNLAMRPDIHGNMLNGIFDFENVGVLDIHEDFFQLFFITPELVDRTISIYNQKDVDRDPVDNQRINLYWRAFLLYLMMENLETESQALFQLYDNMFVNTIKTEK